MTRTNQVEEPLAMEATRRRDPAEVQQSVVARPRGRPKQLCAKQRETMILDAMERVLLARGLHGATMAAIAREAGMSKRTLYQVFDSRAALFTACIRRIRGSIIRPLDASEAAKSLEERLWRLLAPDARHAALEMPLAILRAVIAEAGRYPEWANAFLEEGPNEARRIIQAELDRAVANREIRIADTGLAARLLCDMAYEGPVDRLVDVNACERSAEDVEARLAFAIRTFLNGVHRSCCRV